MAPIPNHQAWHRIFQAMSNHMVDQDERHRYLPALKDMVDSLQVLPCRLAHSLI